jgi:hypothetical protein
MSGTYDGRVLEAGRAAYDQVRRQGDPRSFEHGVDDVVSEILDACLPLLYRAPLEPISVVDVGPADTLVIQLGHDVTQREVDGWAAMLDSRLPQIRGRVLFAAADHLAVIRGGDDQPGRSPE